MELILLILIGVVAVLTVLIYLKLDSNKSSGDFSVVQKLFQQQEQLLKAEFTQNRLELNQNLVNAHQSFLQSLQQISQHQTKAFDNLSEKLEQKLSHLSESAQDSEKVNRQEMTKNLQNFQEILMFNMKEIRDQQAQKLQQLDDRQKELITSTEQKLDKMRETVDEKLHKTLEERLGRSFKLVSEQLLAVQQGLGEMKSLATGVGDLKKVLSNVKTRGVLGEVQLANILEQILIKDQYEANVVTRKGSLERVEFAVKLPGKTNSNETVYLPIDAKFPQEDYHRLQDAYEKGDAVQIELSTKALILAIRKSAKDIRDKYLEPPYTTDFGILFLPIEGLYAEVVRNTDLVEQLQRDFKIIVTGPTTLAAILNSLQMGFRTLAIQQRSSEVWEVLGAVKSEFLKFGGVLEKAQKKINEANSELDKLVTTRTNVINRKLREVEELPTDEEANLLN